MKITKKYLLATLLSLTVLSAPMAIFAQGYLNNLGTQAGYKTDTDLIGVIGVVINIVLGLLGVVAVVLIIIGGFKWMTAGGSDEKIGEAKKLIGQGIIGLIIVLAAWAIAKFVMAKLAGQFTTVPY
jgi:hypothetical protein